MIHTLFFRNIQIQIDSKKAHHLYERGRLSKVPDNECGWTIDEGAWSGHEVQDLLYGIKTIELDSVVRSLDAPDKTVTVRTLELLSLATGHPIAISPTEFFRFQTRFVDIATVEQKHVPRGIDLFINGRCFHFLDLIAGRDEMIKHALETHGVLVNLKVPASFE